MVSITRLSASACALALALSVPYSVLAHGSVKSSPYITARPNKLVIGGKLTLTGDHLRPNAYAALALVIPDGKRGKAEKLFGLVKTDSHGRLHTAVRLPLVTRCGYTLLFAYVLPKGAPVHTSIILTGCKAPKKAVAPPPPPGGTHK